MCREIERCQRAVGMDTAICCKVNDGVEPLTLHGMDLSLAVVLFLRRWVAGKSASCGVVDFDALAAAIPISFVRTAENHHLAVFKRHGGMFIAARMHLAGLSERVVARVVNCTSP